MTCTTLLIPLFALGTGVPDLILPQPYTSHRVSSGDLAGSNEDRVPVPPGGKHSVADIEGPGIITHLWFTVDSEGPAYLDALWLAMKWDDSEAPAVSAPLGPFFALGHGECADVVSEPITVMAAEAPFIESPPGRAAFNCYFPMPFHKRAHIQLENRGNTAVRFLFYQVDYRRYEALPEDSRHFHAAYSEEQTTPAEDTGGRNPAGAENYVLLDYAGAGHYVGCTLHVEAHEDEAGKWYEGDDLIVIDGRPLEDALRGTGTEDYFGMAWGVRRWFQSPYCGTSYHRWNKGEPDMKHWGRFSLYRWHLPDPVVFTESIRVSIEHGHANDAANRYRSVAYWYAAAP